MHVLRSPCFLRCCLFSSITLRNGMQGNEIAFLKLRALHSWSPLFPSVVALFLGPFVTLHTCIAWNRYAMLAWVLFRIGFWTAVAGCERTSNPVGFPSCSERLHVVTSSPVVASDCWGFFWPHAICQLLVVSGSFLRESLWFLCRPAWDPVVLGALT